MAPPLRITRAGLLGSIVVILVAAGCVRLGIWQLHRLDQRRAYNAQLSARMRGAGVPLRRVPDDTVGLTFRAALAEGSWDGARSIVLGARALDGEPGVYLLTPLRLPEGGAVLVNRGWLPSPDAATVDIRPYAADGPARVRGLLVPMPLGRVPPTAGVRRVWYHLDPAALARQLPYPIAPLLLQATPAAAAATPTAARAAAALPRPLPPPALDEGPHLGYAIQWFSFAVIGLVGWVVLLLRGDGGERGRPDDRGEGERREPESAA